MYTYAIYLCNYETEDVYIGQFVCDSQIKALEEEDRLNLESNRHIKFVSEFILVQQ